MTSVAASSSSGATASWWVLDAQDFWASGALDKCVAVLDEHFPTTGDTSSQKGSTDSSRGGKTTQLQGKPVVEGASLLHNVLLAKYLLTGTVIPISIPLPSTNQDSNTKNAQKSKTASTNEPTSLLEPSRYKQNSIKWALASLGYHAPTAWYNLALLFFVKAQFRQAARIAEECLEKGASFETVLIEAGVAVQLHFLLIFSHIKLFNYSHPRIASSLHWLEKSLGSQLEDLKKKAASPDRLSGVQERIAWIHVLRTHLSLVGAKVKATKREMSALNASLYQLAQSQRPGAAAGTNNEKSQSSSSSAVEDDEDRPAVAAAGSPGVASRAVAQILRARLQDVRHNPSKAADELDFSPAIAAGADVIQQLPQLFPDAYWNNLAILSLHRGKTNRSVLAQFLQAAAHAQAIPKTSAQSTQQNLSSSSQSSSADIMYNTGVILMQLERYEDALACFEAASKQAASTLGSPAFPMLGLRLAECHVHVYNQRREKKLLEARREAVPYYQPGALVSIQRSNLDEKDEIQSHVAEARSRLFEYVRATEVTTPATPAPYREYVLSLYSKVLLSYVELESGNYVSAKSIASQAIDLPRVTPTAAAPGNTDGGGQQASYESQVESYLLAAHLYLCESLIRTGGVVEAEKVLYNASSANFGQATLDLRQTSKCALAATFLALQKLDKAAAVLNALDADSNTVNSVASHSAILRVWMSLKQGDIKSALELLKRRRLPYFVRAATEAPQKDSASS